MKGQGFYVLFSALASNFNRAGMIFLFIIIPS